MKRAVVEVVELRHRRVCTDRPRRTCKGDAAILFLTQKSHPSAPDKVDVRSIQLVDVNFEVLSQPLTVVLRARGDLGAPRISFRTSSSGGGRIWNANVATDHGEQAIPTNKLSLESSDVGQHQKNTGRLASQKSLQQVVE